MIHIYRIFGGYLLRPKRKELYMYVSYSTSPVLYRYAYVSRLIVNVLRYLKTELNPANFDQLQTIRYINVIYIVKK